LTSSISKEKGGEASGIGLEGDVYAIEAVDAQFPTDDVAR
jgi:hypothetical protein